LHIITEFLTHLSKKYRLCLLCQSRD